jgi:hypothetical protein
MATFWPSQIRRMNGLRFLSARVFGNFLDNRQIVRNSEDIQIQFRRLLPYSGKIYSGCKKPVMSLMVPDILSGRPC